MLELLTTAIEFGWPLLVLIVALSLYKQTKVSNPAEKKSMMFNTMIGIIAAIMLLIAIVNYRDNFGIDDGKLPISLVMITSLTFLMGVYFSNILLSSRSRPRPCIRFLLNRITRSRIIHVIFLML